MYLYCSVSRIQQDLFRKKYYNKNGMEFINQLKSSAYITELSFVCMIITMFTSDFSTPSDRYLELYTHLKSLENELKIQILYLVL